MAWPKLKRRRSPSSSSSSPDGQAGESAEPAADGSASNAAAQEPNGWSRSTWNGDPGANGAAAPSPAAAVEADPAPGVGAAADSVPAAVADPAPGADAATAADPAPGADAAAAAPEPADVRFWGWGTSAEPDDPSDGLPPDRPEYADGPDSDYPQYRNSAADRDRRSGAWQEPVVTPVGDDGEAQEGIGQHLGNLAHLSGDPRMRAWQRRAIITILVGVAFTIAFNWRIGLSLAVVAAIADTIYRSRTVFNGPAGVKLTRAQRRTVRHLARMERKGYRATHCAPIPGSDDQIDHLVVGPAGVFAIDSEDWDKRMPVRTSSHRQLWHGPQSMKHRLEHAQWEADRASELVSSTLGSPVTVKATMAVYGPKIPWDVAEIRDVDVFSGPRLRKYLKRKARQAKGHRLSHSEIERIDKAIHQAFPHEPADSVVT